LDSVIYRWNRVAGKNCIKPGAVRRGQPYDSRRAVRRMEDFAIAHRGYQCLYAVSELARDEYRRMFDFTLYWQKCQAEGVFMDSYDKVKRPVGIPTTTHKRDLRS